MVQLIIKNLKEVETETQRGQIREMAEEMQAKLETRFKRYGKDLTFEIIVNKSSATYLISAALNMKSKKVLQAEEGKDPILTAKKLLDEFFKQTARQIELERKDYLYKRKR